MTSKYQAAERENAELRARLAELSAAPAAASPTPAPHACRPPTPAASTPAVPKGTKASQWSTVAARKPKKASKGSGKSLLPQQATPKRHEAIVRGFNETSGPIGYTTVYIHRSRRFTKSEVRRNLRFLGIDPAALLTFRSRLEMLLACLFTLVFKQNSKPFSPQPRLPPSRV
ncbi:hypothetical protein BX666DRAFT_1882746 [Dichotomocladium elegans]|nr:hypothetical protein BX666DRAFT_1882746 [Dichotomocladium elegans]